MASLSRVNAGDGSVSKVAGRSKQNCNALQLAGSVILRLRAPVFKDTGSNVIADSMQLIAGRTGQEYNQRKARHGAFWEDRYHATAIEADEHLHICCRSSRSSGSIAALRSSRLSENKDWTLRATNRSLQARSQQFGLC